MDKNMNLYYMRKQGSNPRKGLQDFINNLPDGRNLVMIEIGCYMGESTAMFAASDKIQHVYAIDPWENGYDELDVASYKTDMQIIEGLFDENTKPFAHKITKIKKTSADAIVDFKDITADLIYIDGSHKKEAVELDMKNYAPLVMDGGFVSGHDWQSPEIKEAVRAYMKREPVKVFKDRSWIYVK